jgi:glutamate-5-semialdehyde dehydrogenase
MEEYVDVIVPRGGKGLIERISARGAHAGDQASRRHLPRLHRRPRRRRQGGAHRRQRQDPALRHLQHHGDPAGGAAIAARVLPPLAAHLRRQGRGAARLRTRARSIVPGIAAAEEDWYTEYLAPILAVRVVDGLDEAIDHIARYGSQHTDAIVTETTRARCASCARSIRAR